MLYRGFRIQDESKGGTVTIVIYETCRGHWRKVTTANAFSIAEALVDQLLENREKLFGSIGKTVYQ